MASWTDYRDHHDHPVYRGHDGHEDVIWPGRHPAPKHSLTRPVMPTTTVTKPTAYQISSNFY